MGPERRWTSTAEAGRSPHACALSMLSTLLLASQISEMRAADNRAARRRATSADGGRVGGEGQARSASKGAHVPITRRPAAHPQRRPTSDLRRPAGATADDDDDDVRARRT